MTEIQILEEIVQIQGKYLKVVESMGTIAMSQQDKDRLAFLQEELRQIRKNEKD